MVLEININVEVYDNTKNWLELKEENSLKSLKKFIKTTSDIENVIEKVMERITGRSFEKEMAEANPYKHTALLYHVPSGKVHYQYSVEAKVDGKEVKLNNYYPAVVAS